MANTLKTDVEMGSMATSVVHGSASPKEKRESLKLMCSLPLPLYSSNLYWVYSLYLADGEEAFFLWKTREKNPG